MADDNGPLSKESIAMLEEARQGKTRKFVLVCKGAAIQSLVVYKKGSVDKYIREAKESGGGQASYGVITGKGANLNFKLARSDGFDKAPTKSQTLRDFIAEHGELTLKPLFEIVDATEVVLDENDPLHAEFLKLAERARAAAETHPDRAAELNTLCRQIGGLLDQDQDKQAKAKMETLQATLESLEGSEKKSDQTQWPEITPQEREGWGKAAKVWLAARQRVEGELKTVEAAIIEAYQGSGYENEAKVKAAALFDVLKVLDESLSTVLSAAAKEPDLAKAAQGRALADKIIDKFQSFVQTDRVLVEIDANEFAPVQVQSLLAGALAAVDRSLHE